ncbi:putative ABC transporter [Neospora caninum Liverpool]|uniref:Putative ABC transporter n=1 Tax=Neospora caninum (strain Liverpool) TaxID=572307 RepID=F0VQV0_NEOCL|nr:putative ABC transporter [Neospora caninum Liverpool]CBZ56097.1 putative ABC transporter [Neospora caninum Liverpool]|eukprot:XP_003886123.1 putative ABC transporter [Neospora caninum Liverpool]
MECLRKRTGLRGRQHALEKRARSPSPTREGLSSLYAPTGGLHVTPARPITLVARGFSHAIRMKSQIPCIKFASPCLPEKGERTRAEAKEPGNETQPFASPNPPGPPGPSACRAGRTETPGHDAVDLEQASGDDRHTGDCPTQNRTPEEGSTDGESPQEAEGPLKFILKDIDLCAKPGEMLVIMGPSGSGKTTLLNALAVGGEAANVIEDCVRVSVPQKDKVPELLTVHEYVTFCSRLKMRDATEEERVARVEVVLRELGLWRSRFTRVGGSAKKGLSGGEVKRLALAVELLHNPSLIFLDFQRSQLPVRLNAISVALARLQLFTPLGLGLSRQAFVFSLGSAGLGGAVFDSVHADEPTSGLDAALAFETMKLLLRLARQGGRTILCTIHQPRSQLFAMFDRLVLMFEGRIVFQGPARQCVSYFAKRGFHCPPQFNPADFILDLLNVTTLTANAPLVCPQSEGSLSAQSLLDAELQKVHTLELQRLELLKQTEGATDARHLEEGQPGSWPLARGANGEAADGEARPTPEGLGEETSTLLEVPAGVPESTGGGDGHQDEKESKTENGSSPPVPRHRHHGPQAGQTGRRRRGNEEGTPPGSGAAGGSGEGRKGVSVLSIASAAPSEIATSDNDASGVRGSQPPSRPGDEEDAQAQRRSRTQGGANVSGFVDAEEAPGEIHRVLVDENDVKRLAESYAASPERAHVVDVIEQVLQAAAPEQVKRGGRAAVVKRLLPQRRWSDWGREVCVLIQMGFLNHVRNPMSSLVQLGLNIVLGLIFGAIFFNIPGQGKTFESGRNLLGCLFFLGSQLVFGPLDCLVLFCTDRELFNRDTANGNYTPSSFFVAKSLSNLPFEHIPLTCVTLIAYVMCGLHRGAAHFFIYFFIGQLSIFASTSLLGFISAASPRIAVAQAVAPIILLIFLLVTGYYIRADDIPAAIRWLKYLSPIHYSYVALALNQFPPDEYWGELSNRDLLESYGGITKTDLGFYVGMLALLGCIFRVFSFVCLKCMHRRIGLEA